MARLLTLLTWGFVGINVFPLLWMLWCSLMGNNEILQGKLWPEPHRSDVVFFGPAPQGGDVAGTVNGRVYRFPRGIDSAEIQELDLGSVATSYYQQGNDLWALSPDEGLQRIALDSWKITRTWDWDYFRYSYGLLDLTPFYVLPGTVAPNQFVRLAQRLNIYPLVPSSVDGATLSSLTGIDFAPSPTLVSQLNALLQSQEKLAQVLSEWKRFDAWTNPLISLLFANKQRTAREDRELFRWCLAERFPGELTRFRVALWEDIWVNRLPGNGSGTSVLVQGKRVCVGMWWDSYPGLAIIDSADAPAARWVTVSHGLPSTSIQRLLGVSAHEVLVLHDLGFTLVNVASGLVTGNYLFGEYGLPYLDGRDMRMVLADSSTVLLAYGQDGLLFDFRSGTTRRLDPDALRGLSSEITSVALLDRQHVLLGTSEGLVRLDLTDWKNGESLRRQSSGDQVVHSLHSAGGRVFMGGLQGHLTVLDTAGHTLARRSLPSGGIYLHWRNYQDLWRTIPFGRFLFNSLVICATVVLLCVVLAALASFALARLDFPGRRLMTVSVLATQMIPGILYLIPVFVLFTVLQKIFLVQFVNTYAGIILVYTVFFLPMAIWIMRGFFAGLPRELEEAAVMDGCSPFGAFWRITLPAALPGVIATAIYIFLLAWDELMFAWVLSTDISTATIPVGIRMYVGQFGNRFDLLMAAATVATLPVMVLFFIMQRHIVSGLTGGSVKN